MLSTSVYNPRCFVYTVFVEFALRAIPMKDKPRARLLAQHFRFAFRVLRNAPAFSAMAIVILALGIGANTAVFSVVDAVLLRQLLYGDPSRLVVLWEKNPSLGTSIGDRVPVSHANFVEWVRQAIAST